MLYLSIEWLYLLIYLFIIYANRLVRRGEGREEDLRVFIKKITQTLVSVTIFHYLRHNTINLHTLYLVRFTLFLPPEI